MPAALPTSPFERLVAAEVVDEPPSGQFLNRDLSWLEFNRRVLHEAMDPRTPLLERVRFLVIFSNNLDEFFMKRVGAIKRQLTAGAKAALGNGGARSQHLAAVRRIVTELLEQQTGCYQRTIRPELGQKGIHLLAWSDLTDCERAEVQQFFRHNVFPILTPLAVDPGHPFPFISNLSESLGVMLRHPDQAEDLFARIKVPETLPRWIRLQPRNGGSYRFVSLYDLIRNNLDDLFPGMRIVAMTLFRVTRSADLDVEPEAAEDLRELVEEEIRQRRFAPVVRLEFGSDANPVIRQFLIQELEVSPADVYDVGGEMDYLDLRPIAELNLPGLRYEPWAPAVPPALQAPEADIFNIIRANDLLVHHPYESFGGSIERFISAAAEDPKVLAIKMTLYRTGEDSPFIHTLIRAAESRKQVVCLVELKARFDEERNILLAHDLEKAGVHVVYGVVGLKTHTKTALVVRQESDGIRCYAHIGTGNYNTQTARLYTDLGLLTCKPQITEDLVELFHYLTGRSLQRSYRKLIVAPVNMRERFMAMIEREVEHHRAGRPAHLVAKMNALEDRRVCEALYAASQAGLRIDLIVRGFCCLKPGVPGLSDNIRVSSVIGRFLEHSRIFYFRNGSAEPVGGEFYIGSADWMYRNLLARVEVVAPIEDEPHRQRLWEILQVMLMDDRQAWDMRSDGTYVQRHPAEDGDGRGTQQVLMERARQLAAPPA